MSMKIKPLFEGVDEPSIWQVGSVIELSNGHTKEFNSKEEL